MVLQTGIVANYNPGNFYRVTSNGYNLSSHNTRNFHNSGDQNNLNPVLGPLQNTGGPIQTMALLPGSPAIDAGNPTGCKDAQGNLLTTDQRGGEFFLTSPAFPAPRERSRRSSPVPPFRLRVPPLFLPSPADTRDS